MDFDFDGMPEEVRRRFMEMVPQAEIAPSPLVGVIAIAQVEERNGITVELLSMEVREAGALLHWRARFEQGIGFLMPHVSMTDERSTAYRLLLGEGGGGDHSWAGSLAVLPGPPSLATLAIVFESFGADDRIRMPGYIAQEPILGPWEFTVATRDIRQT